jgi:hypothetical protein
MNRVKDISGILFLALDFARKKRYSGWPDQQRTKVVEDTKSALFGNGNALKKNYSMFWFVSREKN